MIFMKYKVKELRLKKDLGKLMVVILYFLNIFEFVDKNRFSN